MSEPVRRRWWIRPAWVLVVLAYSLIAGCAAIPQSTEQYHRPTPDRLELASITVLRDEWRAVLVLGVPIAVIAMLSVGVIGAVCRRAVLSVFAFCSPGLAIAAVWCSFLLYHIPWQVGPEITDDAGRRFAFGESSFLQGQSLALVRFRSENTWYRTYDVLIETNGDNPSHYLKIVRPAGTPKDDGRVYFADGWIIAVRIGNRSYTAYDVRAEKGICGSDLEELSPFLAVGENDELDSDDTDQFLRSATTPEKGAPTEKGVREGLQHRNPRVRAVAAQWLTESAKPK